MGNREGQCGREGGTDAITDLIAEGQATVEVGRTREGVLAGRGVDREVAGLDACGLVDRDRRSEGRGRGGLAGGVQVGQFLDRQGRGGDVERGAGIRVDATREEVASEGGVLGEGAAVRIRSRRDVIDLGELDREVGRDGRGTRSGVLNRIGDGHVAVVIRGGVEGVGTVLRHGERASLDVAGRAVVGGDVDIDRGSAGGVGLRAAGAIEVAEGLYLQGGIRRVERGRRVDVGIVIQDVARHALVAFEGVRSRIVGGDRGVDHLGDVDVDRGEAIATATIGNGVIQGHRAVEVTVRVERVGAIGGDRHRPNLGPAASAIVARAVDIKGATVGAVGLQGTIDVEILDRLHNH